MISYSIGILTLICEFRAVHPHVTQSWYVWDAGAGKKFRDIQDHMQYLMVRGNSWG